MQEGDLPKGWRIYAEPPAADGRCRLRLIAPNGISSTWWLRSNMTSGQVVCALAHDQSRAGMRHRTHGVIDRRAHEIDDSACSQR
jgi:surface antigen